jgi:LysM repeat protein
MRIALILVFVFCSAVIFAQKLTPEMYIEMYREAAVAEMKRSGVPASITLAQGILETESGNSDLVKKSNNHFGIKCKSNWTGESVKHTDDAPNECFRKYNSASESYKDHSDYLKTSTRYASLFELSPSDYKGWAYGLKKAGYATNPKYPQIVISNIEKYNLQQYDDSNRVVYSTINTTTINALPKALTYAKPIYLGKPLEGKEQITAAIKNNVKINGLKAIYASAGTALIAIATMADIDLVKLLSYNDLTIDGLLKGNEIIYFEKKNKQGTADLYTVVEDESLQSVSQKNAVQLKALAQLNEMREFILIRKGQVIKLR